MLGPRIIKAFQYFGHTGLPNCGSVGISRNSVDHLSAFAATSPPQTPGGAVAGAIIKEYPGDNGRAAHLLKADDTNAKLASLPLLRNVRSLQVNHAYAGVGIANSLAAQLWIW
jgi:hypothetical protein